MSRQICEIPSPQPGREEAVSSATPVETHDAGDLALGAFDDNAASCGNQNVDARRRRGWTRRRPRCRASLFRITYKAGGAHP